MKLRSLANWFGLATLIIIALAASSPGSMPDCGQTPATPPGLTRNFAASWEARFKRLAHYGDKDGVLAVREHAWDLFQMMTESPRSCSPMPYWLTWKTKYETFTGTSRKDGNIPVEPSQTIPQGAAPPTLFSAAHYRPGLD